MGEETMNGQTADSKIYDMLAEIHKQLTLIQGHLATLATVARNEHPNAFAKPAPHRGPSGPSNRS